MVQECFACVIQSLAESVLGRPLTEGVIELAHSRPPHHRNYRQYLHSPVQFGLPENTFRLPAALAREVNTASDARAYALAQKLCRELLQKVPKAGLAVSDRVRHLMLSTATGTLKETEIAEALFMSKRTLARRLDQEGTSYRALREQLLSEMAERHLCESDLTVESVATLLGYNDAAAFRKAFARWFRQSPGEFRKNAGVQREQG
jgi:AraC-like DNA-binding protein